MKTDKKNNHGIKRYHAILAKAILDENFKIGLSGNDPRTHVMAEAISASVYLMKSLTRQDPTIEEIKEALNKKRSAATRYKEVFGINWRF